MAKIDLLGTLTIAAGTSMSAAMSKSVYNNYEAMAIYPPASYTGSAVFLATYETQSFVSGTTIPNNDWYVLKNSNGTNVTMSAGVVTVIQPIPFENIIISGSLKPVGVGASYIIQGQQMVAVTGPAALQSDNNGGVWTGMSGY